jgi:uncharacterized MAPEG superfamily protein
MNRRSNRANDNPGVGIVLFIVGLLIAIIAGAAFYPVSMILSILAVFHRVCFLLLWNKNIDNYGKQSP